MEAKIGEEAERTRPFFPKDNAIPLNSIDWKSRYNELKNRKDWDDKKDFVGLKRLGNSYHPLDPFFKFEGVPNGNDTLDRIWWPSVCGFMGIAISAGYNWHSRRPFVSALLPTLVSGAVGVGVACLMNKYNGRRAQERDAVLIHYLLLHEHEFPRIERKRFGEITMAWTPFRCGNDGLYIEK
ncbi:unnamed protein product [Medioppia subpectinata]|uniref:Uncharacterized protein n=1 Tax=Medioppia subpectinata TaxID=1979941 RepID=A0A7R9KSX9_9ACAR|nr:unnamed protein product [Medioppia subpectinata]CAG2109234.1 unnamed protein product [Medioppia subpectinata]